MRYGSQNECGVVGMVKRNGRVVTRENVSVPDFGWTYFPPPIMTRQHNNHEDSG